MQVVATKTQKKIQDTSSDVTVITSEDLKERTGESLSDVLRDFGIVTRESSPNSRGSAGSPYIRGFDSGNILIIIDGQKIYSYETRFYTLNNTPISQIERVEILEGSSSFLYGSDAMGGVISITTKKGSGKKGLIANIGASYGNNFKAENDAHNTKEYANFSYGFENGNSIYWRNI